jgi:tetratricopeptide (TPR) repeat protein
MNNKDKNQAINLAESYFQHNKYTEAEAILKNIVDLEPNHSKANELLAYIYGNQGQKEYSLSLLKIACKSKDCSGQALYYLGSALLNAGYPEEASQNFRKSILKIGDFYEALYQLGTSYAHLDNKHEALSWYLKAIRLKSSSYEPFFNIAKIYCELSKYNESLSYFDKVLLLNPKLPEAWFHKGHALNHLGHLSEALAHYQHAIQLKPNYFEAWSDKATTLKKLQRYEEALKHYDQAIELSPEHAETWFNKALTLKELNLLEMSLEFYDEAIRLRPTYAEAWANKGNALNKLGNPKEAINHYDKAILLNPKFVEAWSNKGVALKDLKRFEEALTHFDQAIKLDPNYAEAKKNKGLLNISLKKFTDGWLDYNTRLETSFFEFPLDTKKTPIWNGLTRPNHLLLIGEQGIGDEIFYLSMLSGLKNKTNQLTMVTDNRLIPIFSRSFPNIIFLDRNLPLELSKYDAQLPIGSLPLVLKIDPPNNFRPQAFLTDDEKITLQLKKSVQFNGKITCGIAWKSSNKDLGKSKSMNLSSLKDIFNIPNYQFINLQYGDVAQDIEIAKETTGVEVKKIDNIDLFNDINYLLSIIKSCDIVVTTSNITAHLAGAIGKRTFLLVPFSQGKIWYWHDEKISTWYPSINQYFQGPNLDWSDAIKCITKDLERDLV